MPFQTEVEDDEGHVKLPVEYVTNLKLKKGDSVTLDVVPLFGGGQKTYKQLEADLSYAQDFEISLATLNHFIPIWMHNFRENLPLFVTDAKSYTDILPAQGEKKRGLVIANGPSLYDTDLSPLRSFEGTIVCTNKPLKHLLENGIIPDYVCVLDAGPEVLDSFKHRVVNDFTHAIKGILLPTMVDHEVARFAIDYFGQENIFWHNPHFSDALAPNICETLSAITKIPSVEHGGNCLAEDTLILTTSKKLVPIRDIVVGTELYTLNGKKLKTGTCTAKYDKGIKDVYWLKTRSRAIRATGEHMFPVVREGEILWIPLNEITTKDYVVVLRGLDERYKNHGQRLNYLNHRATRAGWNGFDDQRLILDSVKSIEFAGKERVYDITVDNEHNFVANGMITHNCGTFSYLMAIRPVMCNPIGLLGFDLSFRPNRKWKLEQTTQYRFFYIPGMDHYYAMTPVFEYYLSRLIYLCNTSSSKMSTVTVNLTPVGPLNAIIGMKSETLAEFCIAHEK